MKDCLILSVWYIFHRHNPIEFFKTMLRKADLRFLSLMRKVRLIKGKDPNLLILKGSRLILWPFQSVRFKSFLLETASPWQEQCILMKAAGGQGL